MHHKTVLLDHLQKDICDINILFDYVQPFEFNDKTYYRSWLGTNKGMFLIHSYDDCLYLRIKDIRFIKIFNEKNFIF